MTVEGIIEGSERKGQRERETGIFRRCHFLIPSPDELMYAVDRGWWFINHYVTCGFVSSDCEYVVQQSPVPIFALLF